MNLLIQANARAWTHQEVCVYLYDHICDRLFISDSPGPELGAKMFPASHSSSYKSDDNNRESTGLSSSTTYVCQVAIVFKPGCDYHSRINVLQSMRESHTLCSVETYKSHKAETVRTKPYIKILITEGT